MGRIKLKKFFSFFLELLSFDTPRAIVINLSTIIILLIAIPTSWLDHSPARCVFREWLLPWIYGNNCPISGLFAGCTCPGCGMTHALSRLLHLDFIGAREYNLGVFLVFGVMVFLIIWNVIKLIKNKK